MDGCADAITAKVGGKLEAPEEEDQSCCSKTKDDTKEANSEVLIIIFIFKVLMRLVVGVQVAEDTRGAERISNGIHHKNCHNEQCKDLICEPCGQTDIASQIKESSKAGVGKQPD